MKHIKKNLKHYPVMILTGAKGVGKTTAVLQLVKENGFHYVSLEFLINRKQALEDPMFFIQQHGIPLVIDEIQYAPIWKL